MGERERGAFSICRGGHRNRDRRAAQELARIMINPQALFVKPLYRRLAVDSGLLVCRREIVKS